MIPNVGSSWLHTAIVHIEYVGSSRLYTLTAWIRMMLMMHTLDRLSEQGIERQGESRRFTYSSPTLNVAMSAILLLRGRCKFKTIGIGRMRTDTSDNRLRIPAAR